MNKLTRMRRRFRQEARFPRHVVLPESIQAPCVAPVVVDSFTRLHLRLRARMLGRLLTSVGSLALAVVGGGAFSKYIAQRSWPEIQVSVEDAARATSAQVLDLVRYVQQSNPQMLERWIADIVRLRGGPMRLETGFA